MGSYHILSDYWDTWAIARLVVREISTNDGAKVSFFCAHNLLPKNTIAPTRQMPEKESYDSNLMFKGKLNVIVFWCFMKFQAIDSSQS